jgi:hypothetical protein
MRKAIYVGVALLTFTCGGIVYYLTTLRPAPQLATVSKPAGVRAEAKAEVKLAVPVNLSLILRTSSDDPGFNYRTLKLSAKPVVVDDLDIMEDVDGEEITIKGDDRSTQFRVSERYRTSLTVTDEGPHLDLVDWRHYDSEWKPLEELGERRFRTLSANQMNDRKFPPATKAEILEAVRKRAGDWWEVIDVAETCNGPNDAPCEVGVSSIYFRVEALVGDEWINAGVVEVHIPMGC